MATAATLKRDAELDTALGKSAPEKAYKPYWQAGKIVAAGDSGPPVMQKDAVIATLSSRPQGATWTMDYAGVSASADLAYTWDTPQPRTARTSVTMFACGARPVWPKAAGISSPTITNQRNNYFFFPVQLIEPALVLQ
ncbi:MAG: hypothetical protein WDN06_19880 [Asticcacaulis sp.]